MHYIYDDTQTEIILQLLTMTKKATGDTLELSAVFESEKWTVFSLMSIIYLTTRKQQVSFPNI